MHDFTAVIAVGQTLAPATKRRPSCRCFCEIVVVVNLLLYASTTVVSSNRICYFELLLLYVLSSYYYELSLHITGTVVIMTRLQRSETAHLTTLWCHESLINEGMFKFYTTSIYIQTINVLIYTFLPNNNQNNVALQLYSYRFVFKLNKLCYNNYIDLAELFELDLLWKYKLFSVEN